MAAEKGGVLRTPAELLLELSFPQRCVLCHQFLGGEEHILCPDCVKNLPPAEKDLKRGEFFKRCVSVCSYEGRVREAVHRFKFKACSFYAEPFGRLMAQVLGRELSGQFDLVTYVPVGPLRFRLRGYDQARLLAEVVGRELEVPVLRTLTKIRNNAPQSSLLTAAARHANVQNVYRAVNRGQWAGKRLLLIDDVVTTGATLSEASRVLLSHGAKRVFCGTFAATPKP